MLRLCFDIETNSLLNEKVIDYSSFPYKMNKDAVFHCGWIYNIDDKSQKWGYRPGEGHLMVEKLKEADVIVSHNGINFDHLWLRLMFDAPYSLSEHYDSFDKFCGKDVRIYDTMIMSKLLNPDRKGGHSLKQWGKRLDNNKIIFGDEEENESCWDTFTEEMYVYCQQDVNLTVDVFHALVKEAGNTEEWYKTWERAFRLEQAVAELNTRYSHFGFDFNAERAENTVTDLNRLMADCEAASEPHLPPKILPKSKQPNFPAKPFMMSGAISATGRKWIERLGLTEASEDIQKKALHEKWPVELTEPMKLSNQEDVKAYLVQLGWRPTKWGERDLFMESDKKTASTDEQFKKRIIAYINKTVGSPFEKFRVDKLGISLDYFAELPNDLEKKKYLWIQLMAKRRDENCRKLVAFTQPKYTVDMDKNLCPNLERLAEEIPYSKDIVHWLTYRHRRNSIKSPNGTGFLHSYRKSDGRIATPADTLGCNTSRFKHRTVCNIPRVTSLYGEPVRSLFGCGKDYYQVGTDASALEARVQAHYVMPYEGGENEAFLLVDGDIHTATAESMGITRNAAKTERYALTYGSSANSRAMANGWSKKYAKQVYDAFWAFNKATKAHKDFLEKEWRESGQKYITGIDGRKLATRSQHALLNVCFQSCGVIIMKKAHIIVDRESKAAGYCLDPFEGKPTAMFMQLYHDESQHAIEKKDFRFKIFKFDKNSEESKKNAEEECKKFKKEQEESTGLRWSEVSHTDSSFFVSYTKAGEITSLALEKAGEHFGMRVAITGNYISGTDWGSCH